MKPLAPENPHPGILRSLLRAMDRIETNRKDVSGFCVMGADFVNTEYPGEGHEFFNLGFSRSDAQLREEILGFLASK